MTSEKIGFEKRKTWDRELGAYRTHRGPVGEETKAAHGVRHVRFQWTLPKHRTEGEAKGASASLFEQSFCRVRNAGRESRSS